MTPSDALEADALLLVNNDPTWMPRTAWPGFDWLTFITHGCHAAWAGHVNSPPLKKIRLLPPDTPKVSHVIRRNPRGFNALFIFRQFSCFRVVSSCQSQRSTPVNACQRRVNALSTCIFQKSLGKWRGNWFCQRCQRFFKNPLVHIYYIYRHGMCTCMTCSMVPFINIYYSSFYKNVDNVDKSIFPMKLAGIWKKPTLTRRWQTLTGDRPLWLPLYIKLNTKHPNSPSIYWLTWIRFASPDLPPLP